eukprot:SAG31_NODE_8780_length_1388_cov_2.466253_1_plen_337_part_10
MPPAALLLALSAAASADGAARSMASTGSMGRSAGGEHAAPALRPWVNASVGIHRFLAFDSALTAEQVNSTAANYDYVWGASAEYVQLWKARNAGLIASVYIPVTRDFRVCYAEPQSEGSQPFQWSRNLSWWQAHHPDWIVYKADRKTPAYQYDDTCCVPLDISNPLVRQFQLNNCTGPAAAAGYDAVAFDNYGFTNDFGCAGVWRDGSWVQLYSGNRSDEKYVSDIVTWTKAAKAALHAKGLLMIPNWSTYGRAAPPAGAGQPAPSAVKYPEAWNTTEALLLTNLSDGILGEAGFSALADRCGSGEHGGKTWPADIADCPWTEESWANNLLWVQNLH